MMEWFDLFGRLPDGKPLWIEAARDINTAEKHAKQLSRISSGEYFIYSEKHGRVVERIHASAKNDRAS
jgi:hypothetical protein